MSITGFDVFLTAFYIFSVYLLFMSVISLNNKLNKLERYIERQNKIKEQE